MRGAWERATKTPQSERLRAAQENEQATGRLALDCRVRDCEQHRKNEQTTDVARSAM